MSGETLKDFDSTAAVGAMVWPIVRMILASEHTAKSLAEAAQLPVRKVRQAVLHPEKSDIGIWARIAYSMGEEAWWVGFKLHEPEEAWGRLIKRSLARGTHDGASPKTPSQGGGE